MIQGLRVKNVFSKNVTIGLKSLDTSSKVKKLFFNFNSPNFKGSGFYKTSKLSMKKLPDGAYTLSYYAIDNVNNREETKKIDFYLDRNPPSFDANIIGDQHLKGKKNSMSVRGQK